MQNKMSFCGATVIVLMVATSCGIASFLISVGGADYVGVVAGVISVIMFLIYIFGRALLISRGRITYHDKIYVMAYDADDPKSAPVDMYVSDELRTPEGHDLESFMITSVDGIYDLKLYKLVYDNDVNLVDRGDVVGTVKFVNPGHSVHILACRPGVMPWYEVEFHTYDYKRIRASLCTSGRNGLFGGDIEIKCGLRSFLYQFLIG